MEVTELLDKADEFICSLPFVPRGFHLVYVSSREELFEIEKELHANNYVYYNDFINKKGFFESVIGRIYLASDFGHKQKPYFAIRKADEI